MKTNYLIDTNVLIYHTAGSKDSIADALIAATAILHNLKPVTRDISVIRSFSGNNI